MKNFRTGMCGLAVVAVVSLSGCADGSTKSADVSASIRTSLDQAGLKSVTVSQDRDKGIVTLTGNVPMEADKDRAASIAKELAGMQVVANEVAVLAPGLESETKKANAALDKAIESNLEAALIKEKIQDRLRYVSNNRVLPPTSETTRIGTLWT